MPRHQPNGLPPKKEPSSWRPALAADVKRLREQRGWTANALARRAKTDRGSVIRLERGANVSLNTIAAIAEPLGAQLVARLLPADVSIVFGDQTVSSVGVANEEEYVVPWLLNRIHPRLLMALANLSRREQIDLFNAVIAPRHGLDPIPPEEEGAAISTNTHPKPATAP